MVALQCGHNPRSCWFRWLGSNSTSNLLLNIWQILTFLCVPVFLSAKWVLELHFSDLNRRKKMFTSLRNFSTSLAAKEGPTAWGRWNDCKYSKTCQKISHQDAMWVLHFVWGLFVCLWKQRSCIWYWESIAGVRIKILKQDVEVWSSLVFSAS